MAEASPRITMQYNTFTLSLSLGVLASVSVGC